MKPEFLVIYFGVLLHRKKSQKSDLKADKKTVTFLNVAGAGRGGINIEK